MLTLSVLAITLSLITGKTGGISDNYTISIKFHSRHVTTPGIITSHSFLSLAPNLHIIAFAGIFTAGALTRLIFLADFSGFLIISFICAAGCSGCTLFRSIRYATLSPGLSPPPSAFSVIARNCIYAFAIIVRTIWAII